MIKMMVQVWKKAELSDEAFRQRWLVEHGELVRKHARAMGFVRYIQSHKISSAVKYRPRRLMLSLPAAAGNPQPMASRRWGGRARNPRARPWPQPLAGQPALHRKPMRMPSATDVDSAHFLPPKR